MVRAPRESSGPVTRFELEFEDTFEGGELDRRRWLPWYLPHWSSRERSAARYSLGEGLLRLRVDADQAPWCSEFDGNIRVSSLQTGAFAGPLGSRIGQLRFTKGLVVREEQENVRLYTPHYGRVVVRLRATDDPSAMVAFWLIGYEDEPERSGELCVCEIFGRDVGESEALVGAGLHPFGDPGLTDDFSQVRVPIDARDFHVYAAEWEPGRAVFFVDGERVKESAQAPDYPLQLMLGVYEFPGEERRGPYPKELVVDWVRGYRRAG
jgi:hypothetical protein